MDLDLFERIRRAVKIAIMGLGAAVALMLIAAIVASSLRSSLNDESRPFPESTIAAAAQAPAPRASPVTLPVEAPRKPTGDQLRSDIASATSSLFRGIGIEADASVVGETLVIAAGAGGNRNALLGIRDSLPTTGLEA